MTLNALERELWPTWIDIPALTDRLKTLQVDLTVGDQIPMAPDKHITEVIDQTEPKFTTEGEFFHAFLVNFLICCPIIRQKRDPNYSTISI